MNWKRLLGLILGLAVLGFLVRILYLNLDQIQEYEWSFNYLYLFGSLLLFCVGPFVITRVWVLMLRCFKQEVPYFDLFHVLNVSLVVRYIPGTVWFMASRVKLLKNLGVSRLVGSIALFLELAIDFLSAAFLVVVTLLIGYDFGQVSLFLIIIVFCILCVGLHPSVFSWFIKKAFKIFKRQDIEINWGYKELVALFTFELLKWVIQGVAFFLLIKSISDVPFEVLVPVVGIHALAWSLGLLTVISPSGLGFREAFLVLFLQGFIPLNIAIVASILLRLLTVVQEILFASVSLWFLRKERRLSASRPKPGV